MDSTHGPVHTHSHQTCALGPGQPGTTRHHWTRVALHAGATALQKVTVPPNLAQAVPAATHRLPLGPSHSTLSWQTLGRTCLWPHHLVPHPSFPWDSPGQSRLQPRQYKWEPRACTHVVLWGKDSPGCHSDPSVQALPGRPCCPVHPASGVSPPEHHCHVPTDTPP